jgi:hypothetical protein
MGVAFDCGVAGMWLACVCDVGEVIFFTTCVTVVLMLLFMWLLDR